MIRIWCLVIAAVVVIGTAAVPLLRSQVAGTAAPARAGLSVGYPDTPEPGTLIDLAAAVGLEAEVALRVRRLRGAGGFLVLPDRDEPVAGEDFLLARIGSDGTRQWRLQEQRFTDVSGVNCEEVPGAVVCSADAGGDDLVVFRVGTADGVIEWERTLSGVVGRPRAIDDDAVLLTRAATVVLYDAAKDVERWTLDVSSWSSKYPSGAQLATAADGTTTVTVQFSETESGGGDMSLVSAVVDPASGQELQRADGALMILPELTLAFGYLPGPSGVRSLDDETGWALDDVTLLSAEADGLVLADEQGRLLFADPKSGDATWTTDVRFDKPHSLRFDLAPDGSRLAVNDFDPMTGGRTVVLDTATGAQLTTFDGAVRGRWGDELYAQVGIDDAVLRGIDPDGGTTWELDIDAAVPGPDGRVGIVSGRLALISDTHLLILEPS